jgi:hypothetical protein
MRKIILLSLTLLFLAGTVTNTYAEAAKKNKSWSKIKDIFK